MLHLDRGASLVIVMMMIFMMMILFMKNMMKNDNDDLVHLDRGASLLRLNSELVIVAAITDKDELVP